MWKWSQARQGICHDAEHEPLADSYNCCSRSGPFKYRTGTKPG